MSVCVFIAADCPLPQIRPADECPQPVSAGTVAACDDGGNDGFFLFPFDDADIYTKKKFGVYVELSAYSDGLSERLIDYIKSALGQTDSIELWNAWLSGYWEYEDRPHICKKTVGISELTAVAVKEIIEWENWNNKDPDRPFFYCLEIVR